MKPAVGQFVERAKGEMLNQYARAFLGLLPPAIVSRRAIVMGTFPEPAAAQELGRAIRADSVARLPELLEEFEEKAVAAGAQVLWARDAAEANELVLAIARERNISFITKGKSMVTEELGLNETLQEAGIETFETDLGEFIAQQLGRPPFHIVGPAINVPVEEVRDLFMEKAGMTEATTDPVELGYAARLFLRDKFRQAPMGITGVNLAVAETGTIINVENEGNIRFNKSSPTTQVSIMSLEKVVPSMNDAFHLLRLLCRNATGQGLSAYITFDTGPTRSGEIDGPEELFIIIVDNGRSNLYGDAEAREALRCIRCGACLNLCPVYTTIGGYPYGFAYSGPMGQVLNPALLGLAETRDLYGACTLCGTCREVCPGGVDHPSLFLHYRAKDAEGDNRLGGGGGTWLTEGVFHLWMLAVRHRFLWNMMARLARPIMKRYSDGRVIEDLPGPFAGWFRTRNLPLPARRTFHHCWKQMKGQKTGVTSAEGETP